MNVKKDEFTDDSAALYPCHVGTRLSKEVFAKLERFADSEQRSVAQVVRWAVEEYVREMYENGNGAKEQN